MTHEHPHAVTENLRAAAYDLIGTDATVDELLPSTAERLAEWQSVAYKVCTRHFTLHGEDPVAYPVYELPLSAFSIDSYQELGLRSICRQCDANQHAEKAARNGY